MRCLAITSSLLVLLMGCSGPDSASESPSRGAPPGTAPPPAGELEHQGGAPPVAAAVDPIQESAEVRCMKEAAWAVLKVGQVESTREQLLADVRSVDTASCPEDFLALFTRVESYMENRAKKSEGEKIPPGAANPEDQAIKQALEAMIARLRASGVQQVGPSDAAEPGSP
ncbi:MAG: hypothetical protein AAGM22_26090 [Acidobacteriota bacterium]